MVSSMCRELDIADIQPGCNDAQNSIVSMVKNTLSCKDKIKLIFIYKIQWKIRLIRKLRDWLRDHRNKVVSYVYCLCFKCDSNAITNIELKLFIVDSNKIK